MAAAIFVFFWALDRVRKERVTIRAQATLPRATPRELVDRLLKPAAENLSLRRRVQGKPTLSEDLARAGLNITAPEYLMIRIGAVALGAFIGLFRVGGNLAEVLDNISDTLRDRLQTKRDMSVLTAQSRASASIITGLPILLGLGLYVFVPGYYAPMTSTWVGYVMLGFAAFMILIGNLLIQRMTALEA